MPVVCRWQSHQELAGRLVRSSRLGSGILDGVLVPIRVCARLRCLFGSFGPTLSAMERELYDGVLAQSCPCHKDIYSYNKGRDCTYPWRASCVYLGLDSLRSHLGHLAMAMHPLTCMYIIKATTAQALASCLDLKDSPSLLHD